MKNSTFVVLIQSIIRWSISQHHLIDKINTIHIRALYFDLTEQLSSIPPIANRSDATIRDGEYIPAILLEPITIYQS